MGSQTVFFSNQTETLLEFLKQNLFGSSSPFAKRWIIVPSPLMKSWLMGQIALDPQLKIAIGLEIEYLQQVTTKLMQEFQDSSSAKFLPSSLELSLILQGEIKKILGRFPKMNTDETKLWEPLFDYLKIPLEIREGQTAATPPRKSEKRLVLLSERLASLFIQYGTYAGRLVQTWEKQPSKGWQEALWNQVFAQQNPITYHYRELLAFIASKKKRGKIPNIQVEVFGIASLSSMHELFLSNLSPLIPIRYYVLSPCQGFWSDMRSNREQSRIVMQRRLPLEYNQEEISQPLLANMGKLGRKMAMQIENSDALTVAHYVLPEAIEAFPVYEALDKEDIELKETNHPLSLLEALQADMVLMRNPTQDEKIDLQDNDSIQLHVAPTRLREVQIVYDLIVNVIENHAKDERPICPCDITVMAPDIMEYQAIIKAVFGSSESQLDFQLYDLKMQTQNSLVQGFLHLLDLAQSRWEAPALMQFLEYPEVQKKHQLFGEDLQQLRKWIQETRIRWGEDAEHRNAILKQHGDTYRMVEESDVGTWDDGLSRLLMGLAMKCKSGKNVDCFPADGVDVVQGELLGKWIQLLRSLSEDLKPLTGSTELSLDEWSAYLICLLETYFSVDEQDSYHALIDQLRELGKSFKLTLHTSFSWITIRSFLDQSLTQSNISYRENNLQAVRFCSMLPMRAIPSQVIVLMGMQEGVFPKKKERHSLDLMADNPLADYCPTSTDYDRYLFLEAILSARQALIMTYPEEVEGGLFKETHPSLLVTELFSYLDSSYRIKGLSPSSQCRYVHPFNPFDARYFNPKDQTFCSYSSSHYREALIHYNPNKSTPEGFIPELFSKNPSHPGSSHPGWRGGELNI